MSAEEIAANDPETYRAHLETMFTVAVEGDQIPLRLAEVVDGPSSRSLQQFTLVFHGPSDRILPQGMYDFQHDALGTLVIFIVPVLGSNADRILYEACFNRRVAPAPAP